MQTRRLPLTPHPTGLRPVDLPPQGGGIESALPAGGKRESYAAAAFGFSGAVIAPDALISTTSLAE
jgi:hypothetical protein